MGDSKRVGGRGGEGGMVGQKDGQEDKARE